MFLAFTVVSLFYSICLFLGYALHRGCNLNYFSWLVINFALMRWRYFYSCLTMSAGEIIVLYGYPFSKVYHLWLIWGRESISNLKSELLRKYFFRVKENNGRQREAFSPYLRCACKNKAASYILLMPALSPDGGYVKER